MEVHLSSGRPPRLHDADNLRAFKVVAWWPTPQLAPARAAMAPAGDLLDDTQAEVDEHWLRRTPGRETDLAWQTGVTDMLAYARSRGWYDEASHRITVHVVWCAPETPASPPQH